MISGDVGTYKVGYIKDKPNIIYSKMFDRIEAALDYAHKLPGRWVLMQKAGHDGSDYAWKILPYGSYKSYRILVAADHARFIIIAVLALIVIFYAAKLFAKAKSSTPSMGAPMVPPSMPR